MKRKNTGKSHIKLANVNLNMNFKNSLNKNTLGSCKHRHTHSHIQYFKFRVSLKFNVELPQLMQSPTTKFFKSWVTFQTHAVVTIATNFSWHRY